MNDLIVLYDHTAPPDKLYKFVEFPVPLGCTFDVFFDSDSFAELTMKVFSYNKAFSRSLRTLAITITPPPGFSVSPTSVTIKVKANYANKINVADKNTNPIVESDYEYSDLYVLTNTASGATVNSQVKISFPSNQTGKFKVYTKFT